MRGEEKVVLILKIGFQAMHQRKKKKKWLSKLRQMGRMKDPCIRGRRKKKKKRPLELRQMGIYGEFFDILLVVEW